MGKKCEITVIIPAYNEEGFISHFIKRVKEHSACVIVIDDGSSDNTYAKAKECGAIVIKNERNSGKGASIIKGVRYAFENRLFPVVLMDADGQHPPEILGKFYEAYINYEADVIIGNRMNDSKNMPFVRRKTNEFMSFITSLFIGRKLSDSQCGYRLYGERAVALHSMVDFICERFDYDTEILLYASKLGMKIIEISIPSVYIGGRVSRIHPVKDAFRWVKALIKLSFRARKIKEILREKFNNQAKD